ncbi:helix-turn-helix domain-containing protein [Rhodospirillum centenum]|uniref:helix-turn-helix domain-containing protein n=1 Tax=Rhodospirillum centenum TaxID=34018 RepID=UPI0011D05B59|nr:helix-turn-helix domain-containing protein [Rhodospirillum centenum]
MAKRRPKGWHKEDIKAAIRKRGTTVTDLALSNGLGSSTCRVAQNARDRWWWSGYAVRSEAEPKDFCGRRSNGEERSSLLEVGKKCRRVRSFVRLLRNFNPVSVLKTVPQAYVAGRTAWNSAGSGGSADNWT